MNHHSTLPKEIEDFVIQHIKSVGQLEVLMLLHRNAPKSWTADEVGAALRTNETVSEKHLDDLCVLGILDVNLETKLAYRYSPKTRELDSTIKSLSDIYEGWRAAISRLIYAKPSESGGNS